MLREVGAQRQLSEFGEMRGKILIILLVASAAMAQDATPVAPQFKALRGNLQLREGEGSNIVLSTGTDGALLVDAEYASKQQLLQDALRAAQAWPVKVLINTHWHNDHTGGNEMLARAGARIHAQRNTALRLHSDQRMSLYGPQPAAPEDAWPRFLVDKTMQLRWNGDTVDLLHQAPAHTDGDLVVFFRKQNVLVTGDLFVQPPYYPPYFDDLNGGSATGMIAAADWLLTLADDKTIIVPGHGPPTDRASLQRYRDQFVAARDAIRQAIAAGKSEDEVVAMHPAPPELAPVGRGTDRWVRILYREYHR